MQNIIMDFTSTRIHLNFPAIHTPELEESIKPFRNEWHQKHILEQGEQLYHYTDLSGLKGILNERGLWLSHISTLNDPLELKYGQKLVIEELDKRIVEEDQNSIREFYNSIKTKINSFGNIKYQVFVACFCESGNLLSQWRAYSNNGGGFSIGLEFPSHCILTFDSDNLEGRKPLLRKVVYCPDQQLNLINNYIEKLKYGYKQGLKGEKSHGIDKINHSIMMGTQASNLLLDLIMSFKNPAFEGEKEWRLIHVSSDNNNPEKLKFRENNDSLIPYRQSYLYDNFNFPIKSIYLGPSLDQESQKSAIRLFLLHSSTKKNKIVIDSPESVDIKSAGYKLK